jgi:cytosine deaminase
MLERARYLAQRNGMTNDVDLEEAARICSPGGAESMGLAGYGLAPGCRGNVVLVPARSLAEAVALTPHQRRVVCGGVLVVDKGATTEAMPDVE